MNKLYGGILSGPGICFLLIAGLCLYGSQVAPSATVGAGAPVTETEKWILIVVGVLIAFVTVVSARLPDIKTERQLRIERLNSQHSRRAGRNAEENVTRLYGTLLPVACYLKSHTHQNATVGRAWQDAELFERELVS